MTRPLPIILLVLALAAGGWLAWKVVGSTYLTPRRKLDQAISTARLSISRQREAAADRVNLARAAQSFVDRTLGGNMEAVDHTLRSRLNRLGEHVQLRETVVGTGAGKRLLSPAKSAFRSQRALYDEPDFYELEAWISGSGSFEQVLRLVDGIESEPWLKRIDQLKLDPRDNGATFDVTVRLTTLFMPGQMPNPEHVAAARAAGFDRYQPLLEVNPFRKPVEEVAAEPSPAPPVPETAPAPPPFPYEKWLLTGIARGPAGAEAWLRHGETRETRTLAVGESLEELKFVAAGGDAAEFELGGARFSVAVGAQVNKPGTTNAGDK